MINRAVERIVLTVLLACAVLVGIHAGAQGALPDSIPVSIHLEAAWNTDEGDSQLFETGSCSIHISGQMVRSAGDSIFFSHYIPSGVTASYCYDESIIARPYDEKSKCRGEIGRVFASGSIDVGPEPGAENASLFLQSFTGPLGIGAFLQATADPVILDPEGLIERMANDPDRTVYSFFLMVPVTASVEEVSGCETLFTKTLDLALTANAVSETGITGLTGSYSWETEDPPKGGASLLAIGDKIHYGPEPGTKNHGSVNFSWTFGDIEPVVALYLVKDSGRVEFTGEEIEVMAGRKVRLEAEVYPQADEASGGQWELPLSFIAGLEGYDRGNYARGKAIPLAEEEKQKRRIEFYCLDGAFPGKDQKITYSATIKGEKVEGKGTVKVFSPEADIDVIPEKRVSIGVVPPGKGCSAYLGRITSFLSIPGIEIRGRARFPAGFEKEEAEHSISYVQLLKENILERKGGFGQQGGDYFQLLSENYSLDTRFPYAGLEGKGSLDMHDVPSDEIGPLTLNINHFQDFRTTLLVRPGHDGEAIWLPIETIPWSWRFSLERVKDNPGWDETCLPGNFRITNTRFVIPGKREKFSGKLEDVPSWDKVLDGSEKAMHHNDDNRWLEEVNTFRKIN